VRTVPSPRPAYDGRVSRLIGPDDGVAVLLDLFRQGEHRLAPTVLVGARSEVLSPLHGALAVHPGGIVRVRPGPHSASGDLRRALAEAVGASPYGPTAERLSQIFHAGAPGTVVVVDDALHADAESLRALIEFTTSAANPGVHVVLLRERTTHDAASDVTALLDGLTGTTLVVRPVSEAEAVRFAADLDIVLDRRTAERLVAHTAGEERAVIDLLLEVPRMLWRAAPRDLPAPHYVAARVTRSLAAMSPAARTLIETIAVLAQPVDTADALKVAALDEPLSALDDGCRSGLLVVVETDTASLAMSPNPMVRRAVLDHMGRRRRSQLHRRAALVLAAANDRLRHRAAASIAPDAGLAGELDAAAEASSCEDNWAETAELLGMAARLTDEADLKANRRLRAIDARIAAGDTLAAGDLIAQVGRISESPLHDAVLGYFAVVKGSSSEADSRLARAWRDVDADATPALAAMICQRYVLHALFSWRPQEVVAWADLALDLVAGDGPVATEARAIRGLGLGASGLIDAGLDAYDQLSGLHEAQGHRTVMGRGWLCLAAGRVDEAKTALLSSLPTHESAGSLRISLWAHAWLARVLFLTGEWEQAIDTARRGLDLVHRSGMTFFIPLLEWTVSQIRALRGEDERAAESLQRGSSLSSDYRVMQLPSALARASVAEASADYRGVLRALQPFAEQDIHDPVNEPGFWPWADVYANALVMEGELDRAEDLLTQHEALARERDSVVTLARLAVPHGRLLAARGRMDEARELFENGLHRIEGLPLEFDRVRLWFAYGQSLRRAGKRREADAALLTARQLFARLGATRYVERCDREIAAAGIGMQRGIPDAAELTAQELVVAGLVVQGKSNREVAAEIFLSAKTVQYHLTRIYAKLGIRSRGELAARFRPSDTATAMANDG
jgi:DNA-binding CsgD family transcriptional regulator